MPRIQAIDLRSQATVVILVEELPATANPDTVVILKLQAVATRNLKTIPTMLNTIRANTPSKPVPERQCPLSDTLTFLTEQDDEEHDQLHLRLPGLISRYSSPRQLAAFLTIVLMFRLSVPLGLSGLFEISIVNILLVPHAPRIVAHIVSTWLLSFW